MSVLAVITIHRCDGCGEIATVQTDEDCDSFAARWFAGFEHDLCPECRVKPEHQHLIFRELAEQSDANNRLVERIQSAIKIEEIIDGH